MAEPSVKTPEYEKFMKQVFHIDRVDSIKKDVCAWCGKPATEFSSDLSRKEYTISGLCQSCQDECFGKE